MITRWLTPKRLQIYAGAALATVTLAFVVTVVQSKDLITRQGVPLGGDYPVFYGVGSLVVSGQPESVFNVSAVNRAQAKAVGRSQLEEYHAWVYPPYVALPLAPLAMLPYLPSLLVHTALMILAVWGAVCLVGRVAPTVARYRGTAFALTVSFYPMLRAVTGGQNSALSLLLLSGAMAMLVAGRQVVAGLFLGALMFKPHFAIPMIGLVLLARRWRAAAVSGLVAGVYGIAAGLAFGWNWPASWFASVTRYRELEGTVNGPNLISFLGVAEHWIGPGHPLALAVGLAPTLLIIGFLCVLFYRNSGGGVQLAANWAVATAGLILISPHTQFYELGLLALPAMLLADRRPRLAAPVWLIVWILAWSHSLWPDPPVQPLFLLAIGSFFAVCQLVRPAKTHLLA
jgi:hypothetical protein